MAKKMNLLGASKHIILTSKYGPLWALPEGIEIPTADIQTGDVMVPKKTVEYLIQDG